MYLEKKINTIVNTLSKNKEKVNRQHELTIKSVLTSVLSSNISDYLVNKNKDNTKVNVNISN